MLCSMETTLIVLDVLMALLLWWRRGCKWFALIQTLQLLEIPFILHGRDFFIWWPTDCWNIGIEAVAILLCRRMPIAWWLMIIHALLKLYRYAPIDCGFELKIGTLSNSIYYLNGLIILVLLGYALHMPILRLKEIYAQRSRRPSSGTRRPSHQTTPAAATT